MDLKKQLDAELIKNSKLKEQQQSVRQQIKESDIKIRKLKDQLEDQKINSGIKRIKAKGISIDDILQMIQEKEEKRKVE